jgi:long-chain acyl-CoA synthetase
VITAGDAGRYRADGVVRDAAGVPRYRDLPASVVHALRDVAARTPHAPALRQADGAVMSYAALVERAEHVAGGLRAHGVGAGDRVAFQLPNSSAFVEVLLGALFAGAVAVPVNTRLSAPETAQIVEDCSPALVITDVTEVPVGEPVTEASPAPGDLAAIFYTSGTTGRPKGATTTHEALLSVAESMRRVNGLPDAVRTAVAVPLFHVTGCNAQLLTTLLRGGCATILPSADPGALLDAIERDAVTLLVLAPAIYHAMLEHPTFAPERVSSVRWALYGSAPMSPRLVERLAAGFGNATLGNGFGMSETGSLSIMINGREALEHPDSIGWPVPAVDVAIDSPDPDSGVGEILLRGQSVTTGYWGATTRAPGEWPGEWLRTGDAGRIDDQGRVYIVDRLKDVINRGGENVYCIEVESALLSAPGVAEAAVVAVPDERLGERVGMVLTPHPGQAIDLRAVSAFLAERLADYKIPDHAWVLGGPLPRNPAGKVQKTQLQATASWTKIPRDWRRRKPAHG